MPVFQIKTQVTCVSDCGLMVTVAGSCDRSADPLTTMAATTLSLSTLRDDVTAVDRLVRIY